MKLIESETIKGLIVRSKIQWYEEGESSTKYFLNLEKRNACRKHIKKLKLENNKDITDPEEILSESRNFYENLYKLQENDLDLFIATSDKFLHNPEIPYLDINLKESCEGPLTADECLKVLKTCKNNKSPGNDGLSYEFYLQFWDILKQPLVESFNYSYIKSEMSISQRQALITLIDKKGKDRLYIKNWRPISLLNNDYKIASKAIAFRLKNVLQHLIHSDQSGFVNKRNISFALRTVLDIMENTEKNNKNGILLLVDFEKAFDTVSHAFLYSVLKRFNFGPSFIQWVVTFYSNISSCVVNNQRSSQYFNVKRGVRQGDPLSSYLFIFIVEVLSVNVRAYGLIEGITCAGHEIKLIQYADDTTGVFRDVKSACNFLKLVNEFSICSGLKLNLEKTEALWIGKDKNNKDTPLGISWPKKTIKLLGLYIGHNEKDIEVCNFRHKLNDVKQLLNSWRERDLSLLGRILIIKTLALPKFNYLFGLINIPLAIKKEINDCMYEFIWKGKTHKIKQCVIIQDYEYGGYKMFDLDSTVKSEQLKWIKQYINNIDGIWRYTMEASIGVQNLNMLLRGNMEVNLLQKCTPFYCQILKIWQEIKYVPITTENDISNQPIFYNKHICINKRMVYNKSLFDAGIWYVKDLFKKLNNGNIVSKDHSKKGLVIIEQFLLNSIISAIPTNWKKSVKNVEFHYQDACVLYRDEVKQIEKLTSKQVKNIFIDKKRIKPPSQLKYSLDFQIDDESWKEIYLRPKLLLYDHKIQETQFKVLHNYVPTNRLLFKMKKITSDKCNFCHLYVQNLYHLLYDCLVVRNFWHSVERHLIATSGEDITLPKKMHMKC